MKIQDDASVDDLALSVRAANTIARLGLTTVGEVRATPDNVFIHQTNCGLKTVAEIRYAVDDVISQHLPEFLWPEVIERWNAMKTRKPTGRVVPPEAELK